MSNFVLSKTRLFEGVWEGILTAQDGQDTKPDLGVTHVDRLLDDPTIFSTNTQGEWLIRVPVPIDMIGDGAQTFLIFYRTTGEPLDSFTIIAGDAVSDDFRTEVSLLRAELDLLKRAFRRHCVETGTAG